MTCLQYQYKASTCLKWAYFVGQGHSHHKAAPGVGVRLNNSWQPPKPTAIRYTQETPVDREATKLEKLKTVLAGPNTNLGKWS